MYCYVECKLLVIKEEQLYYPYTTKMIIERSYIRRDRTEYQEYLKQKEGAKHQPQFENTSVQEKHQQLA